MITGYDLAYTIELLPKLTFPIETLREELYEFEDIADGTQVTVKPLVETDEQTMDTTMKLKFIEESTKSEIIMDNERYNNLIEKIVRLSGAKHVFIGDTSIEVDNLNFKSLEV